MRTDNDSAGTKWAPELSESLYKVLYGEGVGASDLDKRLAGLLAEHGDIVFSELIYLLSHLRFDAAEAKHHWDRILQHRGELEKGLGVDVDLRVALLNYFLQVNRQLENPKIIELQLFEQTKASAYRDELTGLYNYRFFVECLSQEMLRCDRYGDPVSLLMVDVDDFKSYNDTNGHQAGNDALTTVARLLSDSLREVDIAARYGGEEFALVLPSTPKTGALKVADRARAGVERHRFAGKGARGAGSLTISVGVATYPGDATKADLLVRRADRALYAAKERGKNRVSPYGECIRSYERIDAALDGRFNLLSAESHDMTTINISEGGVLFRTDRGIPVGTVVGIELRLPGSEREISGSGRVVLVEEKPEGDYEAALRFIEMSQENRLVLCRFVRESKRREEAVPV